MNEFKKDFQDMQGRFSDRSGQRARDENLYWTPIVVTKPKPCLFSYAIVILPCQSMLTESCRLMAKKRRRQHRHKGCRYRGNPRHHRHRHRQPQHGY